MILMQAVRPFRARRAVRPIDWSPRSHSPRTSGNLEAKTMTEITTPRQHEKYDRLIAAAKKQPALSTAVAHPCDETSLRGALEAAEEKLIKPILVGPRKKIEGVAKSLLARSRRHRDHRRAA